MTAPAIPAGWTVPVAMVTTTVGATPISSPNMLFLASGQPVGVFIATWGTPDSNGGNVSVTGTGQQTVSFHPQEFSVVARGDSASLSYTGSTFYEAQFAFSGQVSLNKVVAGVQTTISGPLSAAVATGAWYAVTLECNGSAISVAVQRLSDNFWLASSGGWQAGVTTAISVTDTSITGAGYAGWAATATLSSVFGDDWTFETVGPPNPPPPGHSIVVNTLKAQSRRKKTQSYLDMPKAFGAFIPIITPPGTGVFMSGLGSLGCCDCECCSVFYVVCGGTFLSGVTITVSTPTGGLVATGVTGSDGTVKLCYGSAGSYLVSATGTGHTDVIDRPLNLICGQAVTIGVCFQAAIYVFDCNGGLSGLSGVGGIPITIHSGSCPPSGSPVGTGTTGVNGCALVSIPSAGTYCVSATWMGQTASQTFTFDGAGFCGRLDAGFVIWRACVNGCSLPLDGASVTVSGGTLSGPTTQVTDSSGCIEGFLLGPGVDNVPTIYSYEIDPPPTFSARFVSITGTFSVGCGNSPNPFCTDPCFLNVFLTPASDYACACGCNIPVKKELQFTDAILGGPITLTYGSWPIGTPGSIFFTFSGWFGGPIAGHGQHCACSSAGAVYYLWPTGSGALGDCQITAIWSQTGAAIGTIPCHGAFPCIGCPDDTLFSAHGPLHSWQIQATLPAGYPQCYPLDLVQTGPVPNNGCINIGTSREDCTQSALGNSFSTPWGCSGTPIIDTWTLTE